MGGGRLVGGVFALAMILGGGFLALTGLGIGGSEDTSSAWAVTGSLLAGFGIALAITLIQRRR